jgi:hypothetical protein
MAAKENTMNFLNNRFTQGVVTLSASFLLIACGGGGSTNTAPAVAMVPGTAVPLAATTSDQAALDFVTRVVVTGEANTDTPLILGDAELATSEIAEASPVGA